MAAALAGAAPTRLRPDGRPRRPAPRPDLASPATGSCSRRSSGASSSPSGSFPFDKLDDDVSLLGNLEHVTAPAWLLVAFVIVGGTIVTFGLIVSALRHVPATRVAIVAMLEPVAASLVAWAWLGETLATQQLVGGAIVLAGDPDRPDRAIGVSRVQPRSLPGAGAGLPAPAWGLPRRPSRRAQPGAGGRLSRPGGESSALTRRSKGGARGGTMGSPRFYSVPINARSSAIFSRRSSSRSPRSIRREQARARAAPARPG